MALNKLNGRQGYFKAGKIRFFGTGKSMLLKASPREHCAPCNFVLLVTLGGTQVCLTVYLIMNQMK